MKIGGWICGAILVVAGAGCTWVKLAPGAHKVRVLEPADVVSCQKLGNTSVSLMAQVGGVSRKPAKVRQELETLARNAAVDMNGDTVVPVTVIQDGKQTFDVYRCVGVAPE